MCCFCCTAGWRSWGFQFLSFFAPFRPSGPLESKETAWRKHEKIMVLHGHPWSSYVIVSSTGGSEGIDLRAAGFLGTAKLRRYVWRPADIGLFMVIHCDILRLIKKVAIDCCPSRYIGNAVLNGLSGGQRKRTAIGVVTLGVVPLNSVAVPSAEHVLK